MGGFASAEQYWNLKRRDVWLSGGEVGAWGCPASNFVHGIMTPQGAPHYSYTYYATDTHRLSCPEVDILLLDMVTTGRLFILSTEYLVLVIEYQMQMLAYQLN